MVNGLLYYALRCHWGCRRERRYNASRDFTCREILHIGVIGEIGVLDAVVDREYIWIGARARRAGRVTTPWGMTMNNNFKNMKMPHRVDHEYGRNDGGPAYCCGVSPRFSPIPLHRFRSTTAWFVILPSWWLASDSVTSRSVSCTDVSMWLVCARNSGHMIDRCSNLAPELTPDTEQRPY